MVEHPQPEITRLSLQELSLRIKTMRIAGSIEEVLLKALDPPLALNIQRAVASLIEAKALTANEELTPLGRHLAKLPMDIHLGKFLIMSCMFGCVDAALTITVCLIPYVLDAVSDILLAGLVEFEISLVDAVRS